MGTRAFFRAITLFVPVIEKVCESRSGSYDNIILPADLISGDLPTARPVVSEAGGGGPEVSSSNYELVNFNRGNNSSSSKKNSYDYTAQNAVGRPPEENQSGRLPLNRQHAVVWVSSYRYCSVVDPDPYWIRIQELSGSGSVFRLRIRTHTCTCTCTCPLIIRKPSRLAAMISVARTVVSGSRHLWARHLGSFRDPLCPDGSSVLS